MNGDGDRNRRIRCAVTVISACLLVVTGCEPEEPADDEQDAYAGVDAAEDVADDVDDGEPFEYDDPYTLVPFQDGVDTEEGHPDIHDGVPGEDEVRVGRMQHGETGFDGVWGRCREGDYVLTNADIEVCVQNESTNRLETYTGGKLVDANYHGTDTDDDVLDVIMPLTIDLSTASAEQVEVVRDGSDGLAALRVTGQDIDIAQITGVTGNRWQYPRGVKIETEYRLEPGTTALEKVTKLTPSASGEFTHTVGDWFGYGSRVRAWTPGEGFGLESVEMPWVGAGGGGHSFGLVFEETASPLGLASDFAVPWGEMRIGDLEMSADDPAFYRRWFVVGDGGLESIRHKAAELRDEEVAGDEVSVEVVDESGASVEGVEVVVSQDDESVTAGWADDDGRVEFALEEGDYEASIRDFAGPLEVKRPLVVDGEEATIEIPEVAEVTFDIRNADTDEPAPSRVTFGASGTGSWFDYAPKGTLETTVPSGELDIVVTGGMEFDIHEETLDLAPGEDREIGVELQPQIEADGWRSGDFHQHLEPSFDSTLHVEARVKENVTQGVDLAVPTDHDIVSDLQPTIDKLGLDDQISTFPGVEISPLYAHYNIYPIPYRPDERGRGTIPLAELDGDGVSLPRMPEIIDEARQIETDPVIQMNHPRNNSGMMAHVDFDPEQQHPDDVDHDDWTYDIDTIEVINRYGDVCQVLADWSGLLNAGESVTGLGNSDSHDPDAEAGVPRNYMPLDMPPGEIGPDPVRQALRDGRTTVASHAFVDFTDGTMPGDTVEVDGDGEVSFDVRVQTPEWARADRLFAIVNGSVVAELERDEEAGDNVDFDEKIELDVDDDAWVVFWADGDEPTAPVPRSRRVVGFTNPVYLTTDGDSWDAPGTQPLDLEAVDTGYCDD